MKKSSRIVLLILTAISCNVFGLSRAELIQNQAQKSLNHIWSNLNHPDITPGAIIASPSKDSPNYFYHWVRDAGLTLREILEIYNLSDDQQSEEIKEFLVAWLGFEERLQGIASRQSNLGEPIFTVVGLIYPHPWGRPQNDGPAIRSLAMAEWAEILIAEGDDELLNRLYKAELPANSVMKMDLEYIAHNWKQQGFDLWEEVKGQHFFTLMATRAALYKGSQIAMYMNDLAAAKFYTKTAKDIEIYLNQFWDPFRGIVIPTINQTDGWNHKESQLDTSVILASLYFSLNDDFFTPESDEIKRTANSLSESFQKIYAINKSNMPGIAIGRYPEDVYDGAGLTQGNPWFLTTNAFAELFCRNSEDSKKAQRVGEEFLLRSIRHADAGGHLSEQLDRHTGFQRGAKDLTWSYSTFIRAARYCGFLN